MKTTLLLTVLLSTLLSTGIAASAQHNSIYRSGADLFSGRTRLTSGQVYELMSGIDGVTFEEWEKARSGFRTGKGLLIGSGIIAGAGLVTLGIGAAGMMLEGVAIGIGSAFFAPVTALTGEVPDLGPSGKFAAAATAGLCITGAGILGLAAGTAVFCIYRNRMDTIVSRCNKASLSFGVQEHGAGISLVF